MMNQEQAAKYFVVAWVKDWSLRTYWNVVTEGVRTPWENAQALYPWLPGAGWFMANGHIRRFLADTHRFLNDAMWDAKDDKERLGLATEIEAFKCGPYKPRANPAAEACRKARKAARFARIQTAISLELRDRSGGDHWNVCK